ncbi:hypothetical protein SDC9_110149 [bioreactor metagenome]|uniref:Uncharacterized protein n=1 Tax=bioreactor metagenome TaxID=1076179 RepID=A0A645BCQ8_9ZZZZ
MLHALHRGGGIGSHKIGQNAAGCRRRRSFNTENIFYGKGHSRQRTGVFALGQFGVHGFSLFQRLVGRESNEGVNLAFIFVSGLLVQGAGAAIHLSNTLQGGLQDLHRRSLLIS